MIPDWLKGLLPNFWDLHVYGGGLLVAGAIGYHYPPAGVFVFGGFLIYLGLSARRRTGGD